MNELIAKKFTSGRFLLTLICGGVFIYAVIYKVLTPETVGSIITMVFVAYFNRNDRQQNPTEPQTDKTKNT